MLFLKTIGALASNGKELLNAFFQIIRRKSTGNILFQFFEFTQKRRFLKYKSGSSFKVLEEKKILGAYHSCFVMFTFRVTPITRGYRISTFCGKGKLVFCEKAIVVNFLHLLFIVSAKSELFKRQL